jgi:hypothetical protein
MITIQDPGSGVSYFLDPQQKVATKLPAPPTGKGVLMTHDVGGSLGTVGVTSDPGEVPAIMSVDSGPVGGALVSSGGGEGTPLMFGPQVNSAEQIVHPKENSESLGKESISGIMADGVRTMTIFPANAIGNERPLEIVRERWYSADLQIVLRSKQTDPRFGETTYEVRRLDRGEPASSLFEVPSDYKIRKGEAHLFVTHDADSK